MLSAMGFFTVCPGRPVYDIGSPIFDEVKLTLAGGKVFTITAKNVSAANKYIQSATLNGKPLNKPWFEHKDMVNGGTLALRDGAASEHRVGECAGGGAAVHVAVKRIDLTRIIPCVSCAHSAVSPSLVALGSGRLFVSAGFWWDSRNSSP